MAEVGQIDSDISGSGGPLHRRAGACRCIREVTGTMIDTFCVGSTREDHEGFGFTGPVPGCAVGTIKVSHNFFDGRGLLGQFERAECQSRVGGDIEPEEWPVS